MVFIIIYALQFDNSAFLTKLYIIVHLLVIPSEKIQYPAEVRAPVAVANLGIPISGTRPEFGKQILQERQPLMYTHADDDWFVLLEVAPKVSGICLYSPACIFFLAAGCLCITLLQLVERIRQSHLHGTVCLQMVAHIHS